MRLFFVSLVFLFSVHFSKCLKCSSCRKLSSEFKKAFEESQLNNYAGGNTAWAEQHLGPYYGSESHLADIIEKLYNNNRESIFNEVLSEIEDAIEAWWTTLFKLKQTNIDELEEYLCINLTSFCCPFDMFGSDCHKCAPCSPHGGDCVGNGTRYGTGECVCKPGYLGDSCRSCDPSTHFPLNISRTERVEVLCVPCHPSCESGCSDDTASTCKHCKEGWRFLNIDGSQPKKVCADINECAETTHNCTAGEFCVNNEGSFKCDKCNMACSSCNGSTILDCLACAHGYEFSADNECIDINECSSDSRLCREEHEKCINTPGSFQCDCESGFKRVGKRCIKPEVVKPRSSSTRPPIKRHVTGKSKIIWTAPYAFEFLKFLIILIFFGLFFYIFYCRIVLCLSVAIVAVSYLCYQSRIFDSVFVKQ